MSGGHERGPVPGNGHRPADDAAWLRDLLSSEAETHTPDSDRLRAAVRERIDAASAPTDAETPAGSDGRVSRPGRLAGRRLAGVPAGIAAAAFATAVALAVGLTVTRGGGAVPLQSQQAAGPTAVANGNAQPGMNGGATTGNPLAAGDSSATTNQLGGGPSSVLSQSTRGAMPTGSAISATGKVVSSAQNAYWTEEDVAITLGAPVSAFRLTVKVSMSPSLASTGYWTNGNASQFDSSIASRADGVYYTFQLKQGQTLPAGPITFGVQFNHGNGNHDTAGDTFNASVITDSAHGSASGTSSGAF